MIKFLSPHYFWSCCWRKVFFCLSHRTLYMYISLSNYTLNYKLQFLVYFNVIYKSADTNFLFLLLMILWFKKMMHVQNLHFENEQEFFFIVSFRITIVIFTTINYKKKSLPLLIIIFFLIYKKFQKNYCIYKLWNIYNECLNIHFL